MKSHKLIITYTLLILATSWFAWAYETNPQRDHPTFYFFPQFVYIEHFAIGFAAPLGVYCLVYLIIMPVFCWICYNKNYFHALKNSKEIKLDLYVVPILDVVIILLFEAWYQFYFKSNSSSLFQFAVTSLGCIPFWIYVRWLWK
jgi:hypothetical protein